MLALENIFATMKLSTFQEDSEIEKMKNKEKKERESVRVHV